MTTGSPPSVATDLPRGRLAWRRLGFSMVEITIGLAIVTLMMTIMFTMYSRGNKYAAKGTWRVQTIQKQRTALRQIKDLLEKSSYPSVVRVNNYYEASPDIGSTDAYTLELAKGKPVPSTTSSNQYFSYDAPGTLMTFHACTPNQELEILQIAGQARRAVLGLEATGSTTGAMALVVTTADAAVTLASDQPKVGGYGAETRTVLLQDVESVTVGVSPRSYDQEKTVLEFIVVTADPFDRGTNTAMHVGDTAKAVINVRLKK